MNNQIRCATCGGLGYDVDMPDYHCPACDGTGMDLPPEAREAQEPWPKAGAFLPDVEEIR